MNRLERKSGRRKEVPVESEVQDMDKVVKEAFMHFIEYHPPRRLSRNLRKMLLQFLMHEGAVENTYFDDLIHDFDGLLELLDVLEDHQPEVSQ